MKHRKKLIEVALPLDAINAASAREKSIRHGHPSTLHLWWARRPLAAARAVIFAQMVDDPSEYVDALRSDAARRRKAESVLKARLKVWNDAREVAEKAAEAEVAAPHPGPEPTLDGILAEIERQRLFRIIEELVKWENTTNEPVLQRARDEIWQSWRRTCAENADHPRAKELFDRHKLPAFHDPFAGGGTLPLEAQRLGLESYASDLNPVAVLINKAMIEIPPKFAGRPPVNPDARKDHSLITREWHGAQGLAEDVRYYGQWMRDQAEKRIGHLYPQVEITAEMASERPDLRPYVGQKLTVIAWLWARTVKSPNPAFAHVDVPLASSFMLSKKPGKETYVDPVIDGDSYTFTIKVGRPTDPALTISGTKLARGSFRCIMSGVPIRYEYVDNEANAGRMGERLMAVVAEGHRGRVYLPPTEAMDRIARSAEPLWKPDAPSRGTWASNAQGRRYGFETFGDYFTRRQLVGLTTFCDLVQEARERVREAGTAAASPGDSSNVGEVYADAVSIFLACAVSRMANYSATLCVWSSHPKDELAKQVFLRQAIAMTWDFAETNPFSSAGGTLDVNIKYLTNAIILLPARGCGAADQADAARVDVNSRVVSTDPPYYDNIGYADLSDFFYVWLRRALRPILPNLFSTLAVPKAEELVATPHRHGSEEVADAFFLDGMTRAMSGLAAGTHPAFPVTIYYAFKQSETDHDGRTASTGWDTFLGAVIQAGFTITGTWPMRTELIGNLKKDVSALASSIVLVCQPRAAHAPTARRADFLKALKSELPVALSHLQRSNTAPVDLAQAAIGPGMAVYSRYSRVLDAQGNPLSVRQALTLINEVLDEALAEQEGDFDADSRWALSWFDHAGFDSGEYGVAETLSKAKNTSVDGMVDAGIVESSRGKVRLLRPNELPADWNPATDPRLTAWEVVHHLVRVLESDGEGAAAELVTRLGARAEVARELAYRLYAICERKKRAAEALSYNGLVQSWPEITRLAREGADGGRPEQEAFL